MGLIERNKKITDIKKNEIIDGMERALLLKSYDRLTIDDVAKEAEYSKKTIYSYFTSKDDIYLELLIRKFDLLYEMLENAVNGSQVKGVEKIKIIGDAYYRFSKEYPEYMQAIINYETNDEDENCEDNSIIDRFNKETEKSFLLLEDALREGIDSHEISADINLVDMAIILWSNINGFIMLAYKKGGYVKSHYGKSLDDLFNLDMEALLRSLR